VEHNTQAPVTAPPQAVVPQPPADHAAKVTFQLPSGVVGKGDIARLKREMINMNDQIIGIRYKGEDPTKLVQLFSPLLINLATTNRLNLVDDKHREALSKVLDEIQETAPVLHISFTAEPSAKATERVVTWLRTNIHPLVLVQIGLTPNIAAGCILRTPNKVFDMSLKETLNQQSPYLLKLLQGAFK
jgi:F0F1-type ATP synthase delta subunit